MRSTVFAFLGLTAAAGLVLVATFAQLGFPILASSPLPRDPSKQNAVAEAVAVDKAPRAVPVQGPHGKTPRTGPSRGASNGGSAQPAPGPAEPAVVEPPPTPVPDPAPGAPGVNGGKAEASKPSPAPTPSSTPNPSAPASAPVPAPAPAPVPVPVASPPPEAAPPALPVGPGNSSSAAAAAHASPQGIEASAGSNGKALGHGK